MLALLVTVVIVLLVVGLVLYLMNRCHCHCVRHHLAANAGDGTRNLRAALEIADAKPLL